MSFRNLITLVFIILTSNAHATEIEDVFVYQAGNNSIGKQVYVLESPTEELTIDEILGSDFGTEKKYNWLSGQSRSGYSRVPVWLKVAVKNGTEHEGMFYLTFEYKFNPHLTFYTVSDDGRLLNTLEAGASLKMSDRQVQGTNPATLVKLAAGEKRTFYIKTSSPALIGYGMGMYSEREFYGRAIVQVTIICIFIGIALVVFFQNALLFFILKDKVYLLFVLHVVPVIFATLGNSGLASAALSAVELGHYSVDPYSAILLNLFFLPLTAAVLELERLNPLFKTFYRLLLSLMIGAIVLSIFIPSFAGQINGALTPFLALFTVCICVASHRAGVRHAKHFAVAVIGPVIFLGVITGLIFVFKITPIGWLFNVAAGMEVILLSLALSERIRGERDKLLASIENSKDELERKVEERTQQLKEQQAKTMSAMKFASLGEMAGGIAHEINNPLAIIRLSSQAINRSIQSVDNNVDMNKQNLTIIEKTVDRIANIVKGLQTFARQSEDDPMEEHSVQEIINDAKGLCQEKFKNQGIQLIESMDAGDLTVKCKPNQIVQILLNLLNNAYDVCEEIAGKKWIKLEIEKSNGMIVFSITNAGPKIPEETIKKMFEPFFTTKPIGKGTGLGLGISQGIAEMHKGRLRHDETHPNTKFVLEIPASK